MPARDLPRDAAPTDVRRQFPTGYSVLSTTTYCQSFGNFEAHHDTINALFESLEPWEAEMLSRTHFQADVGDTAAAISQPSIVACDGSVNEHKAGAFSWVFSDRTGNRMVLGSGPARGSRITSYRSEGYGILAVTRFLHRLQEYTARSPQRMNHLQIVCDNLSMVRNVHKILPPPTSTGNGDTTGTTHYTVLPLQPEWDVLNEIWHTTKHWHGIRIAHVKGHQDAATPAEQLSIEAILNVQADSLAGQFLRHDPVPKPMCYMFPNTHAHLLIDDRTIAYRYALQIRNAECDPPMHLKKKYDWNDATFATVNWVVHGNAIQAQRHRKTHSVKLVHDILPTNRVQQRWNPQHSNKCALCQREEETRDHLLRCERATEWRSKCLHVISARS